MTDTPTTLHERIRYARKLAGLTQAQLGKSCGVSRAAVAQWESPEYRTVPKDMRRAAATLEVELDWLELGRGPMRKGGYSSPEAPEIGHLASVQRPPAEPQGKPETPPPPMMVPVDDDFFGQVFAAIKALHEGEKAPLTDAELGRTAFLEYADIVLLAATPHQREQLLALSIAKRRRHIHQWRRDQFRRR